jgi:peptide/nickel transport system substrate-binding protein
MSGRLLFLLLAAMSWMAVGGCNPPSSQSLSGTLVYGRGGETDKLDPIHVDTGESVKVIVNLFDTLVTYADNGIEIVPALAEKWETSDDGLKWTFYLRPNVTFHDGTLLTADAVVYSFDRLLRPGHEDVHWDVIPYAESYKELANVRAVDERTVEFTLERPSAVFLTNLAMFPASIVSPKAVKALGKQFAVKPVGTGPFRFDHWTRDQELSIVAFDNHWRGRPKLDRVIFVPVMESAVRIEQLKRGEIQLADDLPPAELTVLERTPDIAVQRQVGMNVAYLSIQNDKPPLNNLKLRQAIAMAINKRKLIDLVYDSRGTAAVTPVPPTVFGACPAVEDRPYDVAKARQLVEEAAAEAGFSSPLKLDLFMSNSPRPYMQRPQETAVFVQQALAEIGIEVHLVSSEFTQHVQRLSRGEHQLALIGWIADAPDADNFLYHLLDPDNINDLGGNNNCRYRNQKFHNLLAEARQELAPEKRKALYCRAQQMVFDDVPLVPLVHTDLSVAHRKELAGYHLHPTAMVYLKDAFLKPESSAR